MKKLYLILATLEVAFASCSTDEQTTTTGTTGNQVTLSASIPNSGTRVNESVSDTYGLVTDWSSDDSIDVLVNTKTLVSMGKGTENKFTATITDPTVAAGFGAGNTIYGVNNKCNDKITTVINGNQLKTTLDFTGQDGTVSNLKKYDLMFGSGDPTGDVTFNHKVCVLRLDINSDSLKADGITNITGMTLFYAASSGTKLFATQKTYNLGAVCDSTVTDVDAISLSNANITVTNGKASVYIAIPHKENLSGTLFMYLIGSNGTTSKEYALKKFITLSNKNFTNSTVQSKTITALSRTPTVKAGDYLFSDGTWGALANNAGKTPIAVIFSNATSITDKGHYWTHGYAMALKNASTSAEWDQTAYYLYPNPNPTGIYITTTEALIADKDGYTKTTKIDSSIFSAGFAAATTYKSAVAAPGNTSSWFLPSGGQWYDIFVNLGKVGSYIDYGNFLVWESTAANCASNINAYLTPLTSGTYETFPQDASNTYNYWCSEEYNIYDAWYICFTSSGLLGMNTWDKRSTYIARSVIAF